jgi:hypothetical protein
MRKVICLLLFCSGVLTGVFAQNQSDTALKAADGLKTKKGLAYFRGGISFLLPFTQQGNPVVFPGVTIAPGLRLIQNDQFIMSLSVPITAWGTFKYDYLLGIDIPFMLDFTIGSATGENQKNSSGFVVGIGYAYMDAVNNYDSGEGIYKRSEFWGWRVQVGIDIGKENAENDRDILFLSYGRSLADRRFWMVGIGVQLMISKP